jgi:hypothetical protein
VKSRGLTLRVHCTKAKRKWPDLPSNGDLTSAINGAGGGNPEN